MGVPWLSQPVMLHSSREDNCKLTAEQCAFRNQHWLYWYQDDHTYALPTVYFFVVGIAIFTISHCWLRVSTRINLGGRYKARPSRLIGLLRYLSYRGFQIQMLGWLSPSLGVILLGLAGTIYFLGMTLGPRPYYWPNTEDVSFGNSPPISTRTGFLALACLPFEMILASKANPITALTGVPHEKLQVFHRWVGWVMFVLALVHTFPFIIYHIQKGDMVENWKTDSSYWTGIIAIIAQAWLTFMSIGPLRNRYYEFFKFTHLLAVIVFVVFFFLHCGAALSSWDYFIAAGVLYALSYLYAQFQTYCEHGLTRANISLVTKEVLKVSAPVGFAWNPGQHVFVRFCGLGIHSLTAHPFTICSLPVRSPKTDKSELVLYIKPHGGVTRRLAALAQTKPDATVGMFVEGPYGGLNAKTLSTFDTGILIAGGSGAGLTLPIIQDWILRTEYEQQLGQTNEKLVRDISSSLTIILATRHHSTISWFKQEIEHFRNQVSEAVFRNVHVVTHYTGEDGDGLPRELSSTIDRGSEALSVKAAIANFPKQLPSTETSMGTTHLSRPNLSAMIRSETAKPDRSVGIVVCGPKSMLHDVRNAAAEAQLKILRGEVGARGVFLHSEPFSW